VAVTRAIPLVLLAGCGRLDFDALTAPVTATATLTVDVSMLASTATDFPLPVFIGKQYGIDPSTGVEILSGGSPVRIEIDDDVVWARVTLVPGAANVFELRFGPMGPSGAWTASYQGVWHMATERDSSEHSRHGTLVGTSPITGTLGTARQLSGTAADYMTATTSGPLALPELTMSAWMYILSAPGGAFSAVVTAERNNTGQDDYYLGIGTAKEGIGSIFTDQNYDAMSTVVESPGYWLHLVTVYDGSTLTLYRDNATVGPTATNGGALTTTTSTIYIGCDRNNTSGSQPANVPDIDFFHGAIDEVRLESVARPADWLGFEDAAMRDLVITYGARN
jgi:hypothetical protein